MVHAQRFPLRALALEEPGQEKQRERLSEDEIRRVWKARDDELTERLSPDGTRTLGRLANRRFVPARPTRTRGR
jgi:hypothetical protein